MRPSLNEPSQRTRPPRTLRPLTKRRVHGDSAGDLYTRSPATIASIRQALALSPREVGDAVRQTAYGHPDGAHRDESTYLTPEVLVYLVRDYTAEAERLLEDRPDAARDYALAARHCATAAMAEMESTAFKTLRRYSEAVQERAHGRLIDWITGRLFDTTARGDVLEVAFGKAIKRRASTFADREYHRGKEASNREQRLSDLLGHASTDDGPLGDADRADRDRRLWAAVEALPDSLRIPFLSYWLDDVQVQSAIPGTPTLMDELGFSSTTIYNRIHEAERRLRDALHDSDDPTSN